MAETFMKYVAILVICSGSVAIAVNFARHFI